MKFNLANQKDKEDAVNYFNSILDSDCILEINKKRKTRTVSQNAYLHLLLTYVCYQIGESLSYFKQVIWKQIIAPEVFKDEYKNPLTGEVRENWKSSSDLDTKEMTMAINKLKHWSSMELGIYLPDANETDLLIQIEKEINSEWKY